MGVVFSRPLRYREFSCFKKEVCIYICNTSLVNKAGDEIASNMLVTVASYKDTSLSTNSETAASNTLLPGENHIPSKINDVA